MEQLWRWVGKGLLSSWSLTTVSIYTCFGGILFPLAFYSAEDREQQAGFSKHFLHFSSPDFFCLKTIFFFF